MAKKIGLLLLICACIVKANGQVGNLDPSFGKDGIQKTEFFSNLNFNGEIGRAALIAANGDIFVVISVDDNNTTIARYSPDGTLKLSYGKAGYSQPLNLYSPSAVMQGANVIVAGSLNNDFAVARYTADGILDSSFGKGGIVTTDLDTSFDVPQSVDIQDGKIVVAGYTSADDVDFALVRYTANGILDSSFGKNGKVVTELDNFDVAQSLAIRGDRIIVAGYSSNTGTGNSSYVVARYTADGVLDTSFDEDGVLITDLKPGVSTGGKTLVTQGDKILLAAFADSAVNGNSNFVFARYTVDGILDSSFGEDGKVFTGLRSYFSTPSLILQGQKIILSGSISDLVTNKQYFALARYSADGILDTTFGKEGKVTTDIDNGENAQSVTLQGDKIIQVGSIYGSNNDFVIARYTADGVLDSSFNKDGLLTGYFPLSNNVFTSTAIQGNKILAAGYALKDNYNDGSYNSDFALARFTADGILDSSFGINGKVTTEYYWFENRAQSIVVQGNKIILAGYSLGLNDEFFHMALARYSADGVLDSSFGENGMVITDFMGRSHVGQLVLLQGNNLLVAGSSVYFRDGDFLLARYSPDGILDSTFGDKGKVTTDFSGFDDAVYGAIIDGNKIIVAGSSQVPGGLNSNFAVARYNSDGSLDKSFSEDGLVTTDFGASRDVAQSIAIQGDRIVVAGSAFDTGSSTSKMAIARYTYDGKLDNSFSKDGKVTTNFNAINAEAKSVIVQADKIIVGGSTSTAGISNLAVARFNRNGSLDSTFNGNGIQTTNLGGASSINAMVLHKNRLYAVGSVTQSNALFNEQTCVIAAYLSEAPVTLSCPADRKLPADEGTCSAVVNDLDPLLTPASGSTPVNYTLSGATTGSGPVTASGTKFNLGITNVTYSLTGDPKITCSFTVTIEPAKEQCNGNDDNCDGQVDEGCPCSPSITINDVTAFEPEGKATLTVTLSKKANEPVFVFYYTQDGTASSQNCWWCQFLGEPGNSQRDYIAGAGIVTLPPGVQTATITIPVINDGVPEMDEYFDVRLLYAFNAVINDHKGTVTIRDATESATPLVDIIVQEKILRKNQYSVPLRVRAYPNPSENGFNIRVQGGDSKQQVSVQVYDISGRLREQKDNIAIGQSTRLGDRLTAGTYMIEAIQGKRKVSTKVIKYGR